MKIFGWTLGKNAVHWYRVQEPLRGLALLGHDVHVGPQLDNRLAKWADIVLISVHDQAQVSAGWQALAGLKDRPKMIYDIDDNVWCFDPDLPQARRWTKDALLRVQEDIQVADLVTTPSATLGEMITDLNVNVQVVPNTVPEWLFTMPPAVPSEFTVGYQGGDTHAKDIRMIVPDLLRFMTRNKTARLAVWGSKGYEGPYADRVTVTPWQRNISAYYRSLRMTVGLAPLRRNDFNRSKSGIKAVEYAALGIVPVTSDIDPYQDIELVWRVGCSMGYSDDWCETLEQLMRDNVLRWKMSNAARDWARDFTTEGNSKSLEELYRDI